MMMMMGGGEWVVVIGDVGRWCWWIVLGGVSE